MDRVAGRDDGEQEPDPGDNARGEEHQGASDSTGQVDRKDRERDREEREHANGDHVERRTACWSSPRLGASNSGIAVRAPEFPSPRTEGGDRGRCLAAVGVVGDRRVGRDDPDLLEHPGGARDERGQIQGDRLVLEPDDAGVAAEQLEQLADGASCWPSPMRR